MRIALDRQPPEIDLQVDNFDLIAAIVEASVGLVRSKNRRLILAFDSKRHVECHYQLGP